MLSIYQLLAHIICIFFTEKTLIIAECAGFLNLTLNTQNLHLLLGFTTAFHYWRESFKPESKLKKEKKTIGLDINYFFRTKNVFKLIFCEIIGPYFHFKGLITKCKLIEY